MSWESSLMVRSRSKQNPMMTAVTGFGYLTEGEHAVEIHVEDSTGKTGSDSVI